MDVLDYLYYYGTSYANKPALKNEKELITYGELLILVQQYSMELRRIGYREKDTVLLNIQSKIGWVISFLGLLELDCFIVPVSDQLKDYELEEIKSATQAQYIIDEFILQKGIYTSEYDQGSEHKHSGGIYHITSGSTGTPKFCVRSIEQLTEEGLNYRHTFHITMDDRVLSAAPIYHSYALGAACMSSIVSGACLYTMDNFIPRKAIHAVMIEKITILIFVPIMAKLMSEVQLIDNIDFSSVRIALAGAGEITRDLFDVFYHKFGIYLMSNFGSTEIGGFISRLEKTPFNSIGKPMVGIEIKILDDKNEAVPPFEKGNLWVKSKAMFSTYLNSKDSLIDKNGFYPMDDIVYADKEGYIFLVGRKNMFMNIGGKKVNPKEIEKIIALIPQVKDCTVVGIDGHGITRIKAYIVADNLTEQQVRECCRQKLSSYKTISEIQFVKRIPRNEIGKISYAKIMEEQNE